MSHVTAAPNRVLLDLIHPVPSICYWSVIALLAAVTAVTCPRLSSGSQFLQHKRKVVFVADWTHLQLAARYSQICLPSSRT